MEQRVAAMAVTFADVLQHYMIKLLEALPLLGAAVGVFLLFWIAARYVSRWVRRLSTRAGADHHIVGLFERTTRYTLLVLGCFTSVGTLGVDLTAVVATAGLVGFAVSFAFQDIIGNFLAGLLIMLQRPFRLGDFVSVAGVEGFVEDIRVRDTVVRTRDGRLSVVPNRNILSNTITNFTANPLHQLETELTITADSDIDAVRRTVVELLTGIQGVISEPAPEVLITKVSAAATSVVLRVWVDTRIRHHAEVRSDLLEAVKKRFSEAGITLC